MKFVLFKYKKYEKLYYKKYQAKKTATFKHGSKFCSELLVQKTSNTA